MGYEITSTDVTTSFAAKDADKICGEIREMAKRFDHYGWKEDVLNAKSIFEIANTFQADINRVDEERLTLSFKGIYRSMCFDDIIEILAPYMSDGHIEGESSYGLWKIVFRDGKAYRWDNYNTYGNYPEDCLL